MAGAFRAADAGPIHVGDNLLGRVEYVQYDTALAQARGRPTKRRSGLSTLSGLEGRKPPRGHAAGRLDLDHLGTEISEHSPRTLSPSTGRIDYADTLERSGRTHAFSLPASRTARPGMSEGSRVALRIANRTRKL